jgi:SAM-dependent methyltransferase
MEDQTRKEIERSTYERTRNRQRPTYGSLWNRGLYQALMGLELEPELQQICAVHLSGQKVLILGAGPGEVETVRRYTDRIVAINIAEKAVRDVQQRFPEVRAFVADAEKLDALDETFDTVYCKSILHHLHPLDEVLASIARRLRPDGVLLVAMEPGLLNPFAALGRTLTPTQSHTPGEKPFVFSRFSKQARAHFQVVYERQHFVWSMLLPLVAKRLPALEPALRTGIDVSVALEAQLRRVPPLRDLFWVMTGVYRVQRS